MYNAYLNDDKYSSFIINSCAFINYCIYFCIYWSKLKFTVFVLQWNRQLDKIYWIFEHCWRNYWIVLVSRRFTIDEKERRRLWRVLQIHFLWNYLIYRMMAYWGSSNKLYCLYLRTRSLLTVFSYRRSQKFLKQVYFHYKLAISFLEKSAFETSLSTPLLTSLIPSTNTYLYALYLFFISFIDYL